MNMRRLAARVLYSRTLILAVALLGGLALTLGLLWMLGQPIPVAAAPAAKKVLSPAQEPTEKPLQAPLQASGWTTRTEITIYYSGTSVLTDYQVSLTIPYSTGMQDNFDDLRFGDADGNCLSYWVESITGTALSTTATVWVKVPSIVSPTTTIYMYYGNSSASSASDGDATFEFFDDFSTNTIGSKWENKGIEDAKVENGHLRLAESNGELGVIKATTQLSVANDYKFVYRYKRGVDFNNSGENPEVNYVLAGLQIFGKDSLHSPACGGGGWLKDGYAAAFADYGGCAHDDGIVLYDKDCTNFQTDSSWENRYPLWYIMRVEKTGSPSSSTVKAYVDDAQKINYPNLDLSSSGDYFGLVTYDNDAYDKFDWIFVGKHTSSTLTTTLGSPIQVPDLVVFKSVRSTTLTPTLVNAGDPITYTITFTNENGNYVTGAVITDRVPVSVTNTSVFSSCTAAITQTKGAPIYTWDIADLAPGASCVITISGEVSATLSGGDEFANTVTAAEGSGGCPCNNTDSVAVTVNHYPTATASIAQQNVNLCTYVDKNNGLNGDASLDVEDLFDALAFKWTQVNPTGGDPAHFDDPFTHTTGFTTPCATEDVITFTLTVTDTGGLTDTDTITVLVKNIPVSGTQAFNSSTTTLGCTTRFTAEIKEGSSVTYTWDFDDGVVVVDYYTGTVLYNNYINHVYTTTGAMDRICGNTVATFTAVVTASNVPTQGEPAETVSATTLVTITNQAPVAIAGLAPPLDRHQQAVIESPVTLDGSASYDDNYPCHDIEYYHWEQTGGFTATLDDPTVVSPTLTAPSPPTLPTVITFTLTVTDSGCLTDSDLVTITLVPPVGGHTAPMDAQSLLWNWAAWIAMLGAAAVFTVAAFRRRTTETSASTR